MSCVFYRFLSFSRMPFRVNDSSRSETSLTIERRTSFLRLGDTFHTSLFCHKLWHLMSSINLNCSFNCSPNCPEVSHFTATFLPRSPTRTSSTTPFIFICLYSPFLPKDCFMFLIQEDHDDNNQWDFKQTRQQLINIYHQQMDVRRARSQGWVGDTWVFSVQQTALGWETIWHRSKEGDRGDGSR